MTIPSTHAIGDTGHVADHNLIVGALTSLQASVDSLTTSGLPAGAVYVYVGPTDPAATMPYLWVDTSQSPPALNYVFYQASISAGSVIIDFGGSTFAGWFNPSSNPSTSSTNQTTPIPVSSFTYQFASKTFAGSTF
jgi:hypothetical protein